MKKRMLITAGSTVVPIDQVRSIIPWFDDVSTEVQVAISNIFQGRTGCNLAEFFSQNNFDVTLLTSNSSFLSEGCEVNVVLYKTYREILAKMEQEIKNGKYDVVIHSPAISDYEVDGIYVMNEDGDLIPLDATKKVSSSHKKLYLTMTPTVKIIDQIRSNWGFAGYLVKFKLEVGISNYELSKIAKKSREHSSANLIVANCLEWSGKAAFCFNDKGQQWMVKREDLGTEILKGLV